MLSLVHHGTFRPRVRVCSTPLSACWETTLAFMLDLYRISMLGKRSEEWLLTRFTSSTRLPASGPRGKGSPHGAPETSVVRLRSFHVSCPHMHLAPLGRLHVIRLRFKARRSFLGSRKPDSAQTRCRTVQARLDMPSKSGCAQVRYRASAFLAAGDCR